MTRNALERLILKWHRKPSTFPVDMWGVKLKKEQALAFDILFDPARPKAKVAVAAFRGFGKNALQAWAVIYFLIMYEDAVVVTFSATWLQVLSIQWREIRYWHSKARFKQFMGDEPRRSIWEPMPGYIAQGVSPKEPGKIEGFHARDKGAIMVVGDECHSVEDSVWAATRGYDSGAKVCKRLICSRGGLNSGFFYRAKEQHNPKDPAGWYFIHVDGETSPDCDPEWREGLARDWGPDSTLYLAHVRAMFYSDAQIGLCRPEWLDIARRGGKDVQQTGPIIVGADFGGGGGSLSAFLARQGGVALGAETHDLADTMPTVGHLSAFADLHKTKKIVGDYAGIGKGPCDRLLELGYQVTKYNGANRPDDREQFRNRRAEDSWGLRVRLEEGRADWRKLPEAFYQRLAGQLCALRWTRNSAGQVVIESKQEYIRRRSQGSDKARSPDEADAAVYAYAKGATRNTTKVAMGSKSKMVKF